MSAMFPLSKTTQHDADAAGNEPVTFGLYEDHSDRSAMMTPLAFLSHITHRITALCSPLLLFDPTATCVCDIAHKEAFLLNCLRAGNNQKISQPGFRLTQGTAAWMSNTFLSEDLQPCVQIASSQKAN